MSKGFASHYVHKDGVRACLYVYMCLSVRVLYSEKKNKLKQRSIVFEECMKKGKGKKEKVKKKWKERGGGNVSRRRQSGEIAGKKKTFE